MTRDTPRQRPHRENPCARLPHVPALCTAIRAGAAAATPSERQAWRASRLRRALRLFPDPVRAATRYTVIPLRRTARAPPEDYASAKAPRYAFHAPVVVKAMHAR